MVNLRRMAHGRMHLTTMSMTSLGVMGTWPRVKGYYKKVTMAGKKTTSEHRYGFDLWGDG